MFDLVFVLEIFLAVSIAFTGSEYMSEEKVPRVYAGASVVLSISLFVLVKVLGYEKLEVFGINVLEKIPPVVFVALAIAFLVCAACFFFFKVRRNVALLISLYTFCGILILFKEFEFHPELSKAFVVTCIFLTLMYRARPRRQKKAGSLVDFGKDLLQALGFTFAAFVPFIITVAAFFLVLTSVSDAMGVPHAWMNPLVFYGIFYAPHVAWYIFYQGIVRKKDGYAFIV